jgi:hypothetical protein
MTDLSRANAIRLGAQVVDAVYKGATKVWPRRAAIVILAGQSLASVRTSEPILLSTAPNSFMPVGGTAFALLGGAYNELVTYTPMASKATLAESTGQSPVSPVASTVVGGGFSRAYLYSVAQPGLPILNNIVKAGKANLNAVVHALCDFARADGYEPVVMYYLCTGEADSDAGTTSATFQDRVGKFVSMARLYAAQAMQDASYIAPVFATYANQMWNGEPDRVIKEALRVAGLASGVYVLGGAYPYPVTNDRIHNTNLGEIYRGEMVGRAMKEWDTTASVTESPYMTGATLSGTTFVATFSENMVRDTTLGCGQNLNTSYAKDGFEWLDNGSYIKIDNLVYSGNTVTGTLHSAPVGTIGQQRLRIALQDTPGTALIAYGNIAGCVVRADTAGWLSPYDGTYTHRRWAIPQQVTPVAA